VRPLQVRRSRQAEARHHSDAPRPIILGHFSKRIGSSRQTRLQPGLRGQATYGSPHREPGTQQQHAYWGRPVFFFFMLKRWALPPTQGPHARHPGQRVRLGAPRYSRLCTKTLYSNASGFGQATAVLDYGPSSRRATLWWNKGLDGAGVSCAGILPSYEVEPNQEAYYRTALPVSAQPHSQFYRRIWPHGRGMLADAGRRSFCIPSMWSGRSVRLPHLTGITAKIFGCQNDYMTLPCSVSPPTRSIRAGVTAWVDAPEELPLRPPNQQGCSSPDLRLSEGTRLWS